MIKIIDNAKEQIETAFMGCLKGIGTNTADVGGLQYLEVPSYWESNAYDSKALASYNQTPTMDYCLAENCAMKSGMTPTTALVNDMMRKYKVVHDKDKKDQIS